MKYDDISPTMRRFIGGREAFRKLGFAPDDLYCVVERSVNLGGALGCFVQLRSRGRVFHLEVGPVVEPKAFGAEYIRVANAVNSGEVAQTDLDRMWQESEPYCNALEFILALKRKGIEPLKDVS